MLTPDPTDFATDSGIGSITVDGAGAVYTRPTSIGLKPCPYLRFDAQGGRTGFQAARTGEVSEEWLFRPGGQDMLVVAYERCYLFDDHGKETRRVERRADGMWMGRFVDAAVANDGGFAIVATNRTEHSEAVTVFSAAGIAERDIEVPDRSSLARVAMGRSLMAVMSGKTLLLLDRATGRTKSFGVPAVTGKSYLLPAIPQGEHELWLIDVAGVKVERYSVPQL